MLEQLLEALRNGPRTLSELRKALNLSPGQLESALLQLRRGGYVDQAIPDQGACRSGCGVCSVKNFCPSSSPPPGNRPESPSNLQETWRLTDKALSRVAPPA